LTGESPPIELLEAQTVDDLARRYGQMPSAILREDASVLLRIRSILAESEEP
jgi:hypothetical protein